MVGEDNETDQAARAHAVSLEEEGYSLIFTPQRKWLKTDCLKKPFLNNLPIHDFNNRLHLTPHTAYELLVALNGLCWVLFQAINNISAGKMIKQQRISIVVATLY